MDGKEHKNPSLSKRNSSRPLPGSYGKETFPMRAKVAFGDLSQNCFADQRLGILLRKTINFAPPFPLGQALRWPSPAGKGDHVVVDEENPYIAV